MDTPTARVIAQPRILSFLHILTFSPFFSPFSWNFSFVALHLFPRFSVFLGETLSFTDKESGKKEANRQWNEKRCISDPEDRILIFFFFFRKLAFPKNRSRLGESNVGSWWNGCLSGFFLCSYMLLPLCGIFFIFLLFFFSADILYWFPRVDDGENWNSAVTRNSAVRQNGSIYSAGREKCPAGPSTRLIRPGPIKLSAEINLPLVCYPVIVSSSVTLDVRYSRCFVVVALSSLPPPPHSHSIV